MVNREKVQLEVIEAYHLILSIKYHLNLMSTFYVRRITKNSISLSKLDVVGYFLSTYFITFLVVN